MKQQEEKKVLGQVEQDKDILQKVKEVLRKWIGYTDGKITL